MPHDLFLWHKILRKKIHTMIIKNGLVFTENKSFERKDIYIEDDRFVSPVDYTGSSSDVIDAADCYVIPGLIDIHSHGAVGCDFSDGDKDGLKKILAYERACGITTYCPTSMTLPEETLKKAYKSLNDPVFFHLANDRTDKPFSGQSPKESGYARVAGINMEGPFLDEAKKGAHQACYLKPATAAFFDACQKAASGAIRLVTVAPNIAGNMDFISDYHDKVTISLGHTSCNYDTAKEAIAAGANHLTHLFNAMPSLLHREPGLIGAAMDNRAVYAELIADGIHVHDAMIRNAFFMFSDHICLISDSIRGTGLSDGSYELGGQIFHVNGKLATLDDGTIAGSVTNLYDAMCHAIAIGIPMEEVIAAATINPAKSIGIYDQVGSITPGKYADVLIVNKKMELQRVL